MRPGDSLGVWLIRQTGKRQRRRKGACVSALRGQRRPSRLSLCPRPSPCLCLLFSGSVSLDEAPCGGRIPGLCKNVTSSQRLGSTVKNAEMTPWTCTLGRKPRRSPAADIAVLPLAVLLCLERDNSTLSKGCSAPRWGWRVTRKPGGAPHTLQDQSSRSCGRGFPLPVQTPVTSMNFTRILGGRDCACPRCSRKGVGAQPVSCSHSSATAAEAGFDARSLRLQSRA